MADFSFLRSTSLEGQTLTKTVKTIGEVETFESLKLASLANIKDPAVSLATSKALAPSDFRDTTPTADKVLIAGASESEAEFADASRVAVIVAPVQPISLIDEVDAAVIGDFNAPPPDGQRGATFEDFDGVSLEDALREVGGETVVSRPRPKPFPFLLIAAVGLGAFLILRR